MYPLNKPIQLKLYFKIVMVFYKYLYFIQLLIHHSMVKPTRGDTTAKCERLHQANCFGNTLNFSYTSASGLLATDSRSQNVSRKKLGLWEPLKAVPVCWHILEPLLCQVYFPKCENDSILWPCRSACERIRSPCKVIIHFNGEKWPDVLNCERFPDSDCQDLNLDTVSMFQVTFELLYELTGAKSVSAGIFISREV